MRIRPILIIAAAAAFAAVALAQEDEDASGSGMSRDMKRAIMFYERGEDAQAMDRFMEILTKGAPSERPVANEYLNLISRRMNTQNFFEPTTAAPMRPAPGSVLPVMRRDLPIPQANKDLMQKEIKDKLHYLLQTSLQELRNNDEIRVAMLDNGNPSALGIPAPLLFSSGIVFHKGAAKILDALTRLVYSLGGTQAVILPEGAALGDAKLLDMRRSMGVSAQLFSSGIAAPRVKVNLLNTQVDIPRSLQDFKGIIILFVYNRPLGLVVENALGEESGPPITLGVYPQAFWPDKNEGAIIEFSVSAPPAGLVSWKFQLLQPAADSAKPALLQEVIGAGPVFHQIYWNGRQNYFGSILPAGRYECVMTAVDAKNRTHTLHRWIQLLGDVPTVTAAQKGAAAAEGEAISSPGRGGRYPIPEGALANATAPSADLPQEPAANVKYLIKEDRPRVASAEIALPAHKSPKKVPAGKAGRRKLKGKGLVKARPAAKTEAEPMAQPQVEAAGATPSAMPASGVFEVPFKSSSHQMTPEGEKILIQAAAAVTDHPLENLELMGTADASEPDARVLAERRAQMIAGLLINRYQVEPKRIHIRATMSEDRGAKKVDIRFVGKD